MNKIKKIILNVIFILGFNYILFNRIASSNENEIRYSTINKIWVSEKKYLKFDNEIKRNLYFYINQQDLDNKKIYILTIENGIKYESLDNLSIKINNQIVTQGINYIDKNTRSISVKLLPVNIERNKIEITSDKKVNGDISVLLQEFIDPSDIPGSLTFDVPVGMIGNYDYRKGVLTVKFIEGMKVRLTEQNGIKKLVDLNGISLTTFERMLEKLNISYQDIQRSSVHPYEENDIDEYAIEKRSGGDTVNMNLSDTIIFCC